MMKGKSHSFFCLSISGAYGTHCWDCVYAYLLLEAQFPANCFSSLGFAHLNL